MAYFAQLDSDNRVLQVICVNNDVLLTEDGNESEELGVAFLRNLLGADTNWKQTSYNGSFRKRYAGIGHTYDSVRDAFIPPRIFLSWNFNSETLDWDPPVPYPEDGKLHEWDESTRQWVEVTE